MPRQKLTKRANGRYACKYDNRFFYGKTTAEALRKRDEYASQQQQGYNMRLADVILEEYGMTWLDTYHTECNRMQRQYENFIHYAVRHMRAKLVRDVTATDVQRLFNTLDGYSQSHINKFSSTIRSIFCAAVQDGIILRNPAEMAKPPKGVTGGHRALEQWEKALVNSTCQEHEFGLCAMVMMYAGLRRGDVLYLDIDRDVDFENKTLTVRGAVSFCEGNQGVVTDGKTEADQRVIPLPDRLADALRGHHGLLCRKANGERMSESAFDRKYQSYITFLERKLNGCLKRWYGLLKEHKALITAGKELPLWLGIDIRCHDFRVTYCTMCYEAEIPVKTLQVWMGHADTQLILNVYTKLTKEKEQSDATKLNAFFNKQVTTSEIFQEPETLLSADLTDPWLTTF